MLSKNDNMLDLSYNVHIDAAVVVFAGGGQALTVFYGGQHDSIG